MNNDLGALETAFYVRERLAFASRGRFSFGLRHLLVAEAWRGNLDDKQKPAQAPRRVVWDGVFYQCFLFLQSNCFTLPYI